MTAAIATIGHNGGPEISPFELSAAEVANLCREGGHWLDGAPVTTTAEATAISKLLSMFREAEKRIDARRKAEAEPHDIAKAAIQERYGALIGNTKTVKGSIPLAVEACKRALTPWLEAEEARKHAEASAARKAADEAAERAREAFQSAPVTDLSGRLEAERLAGEAKRSEVLARDADNDRAAARGGSRAVTLRTSYRAEVVDRRAFLKWVAENRADELTGMLRGLADRLCSAGVRNLPGISYTEERSAR